ETVGGAAGVGDDLVLGRIVGIVVDAEHERHVFILRRGGDDDLLHAAAQVLGGVLGISETAGGFDHDVRAHAGPIQLGGILHGENIQALAAYGDGVRGVGHRFGQRAEHGIIFQKMGEGFCVGEVVDRNEFNIVPMQTCTNDITADPAEAINTYFD